MWVACGKCVRLVPCHWGIGHMREYGVSLVSGTTSGDFSGWVLGYLVKRVLKLYGRGFWSGESHAF